MEIAPFVWLTGMGYSPPTWKLADWPLITVRFGSARTCARLSLARASMTPLKLPEWHSGIKPPDPPPAPHCTVSRLAFSVSAGRPPIAPMVPSACQLTPRFRITVRDISAIRTFNVTWIGDAMVISLSMFGVSPANSLATARACAASLGLDTVPDSSRPFASACTCTWLAGSRRAIID